MIGKVTRGERVAGLLHYLFGPGRSNEHTDPHLAAAWDPVDELQPAVVDGRHDLQVLTGLLVQPLVADFRQKPHPVWHCGLRNAPSDRHLSDAEWDTVVREVLHRTGLAPRDDDGACRWVAVRHAVDHVHVVVTLARQDGRPVSTNNDFYRVGEACRAMEERFDLQRTGARDRTAGRRPSRAETEKAQRDGRSETPRVMLRRAVSSAAAVTDSPEAFLAELRAAGVLVNLRYSEVDPEKVTGYSVAWPGDHTADGAPVYFGGSKLAPELSWARLGARWQQPVLAPRAEASAVDGTGWAPERDSSPVAVPGPSRELDPSRRRDALDGATAAIVSAGQVLSGGGPASAGADDIAAAAGDVIAVTGRLVEGRADGYLSRIGDRYQRAARVPWARRPEPSATAAVLRRAARELMRLRRARPSEREEVIELMRATASFVDALAALRAAQHRPEQAVAALESAVALRAHAAALTSAVDVSEHPQPAVQISVPRQRTSRGAS
ncbi:relaxase/mobilization nuclease domain-containing protein [Quadrisphaera sp. INWT6]|uniref:relaxase/mobilization nuclease domain-containing protein n=1 Tax=Quadrisphaera sp. INWT6 TaxID=2596917 RepID=UPI0018922D70|nr:relaxase [Quadrisphaera sp. INWT6]MBF5082386.1 relaxase [Quadrisphaera sp. INWT6]